MPPLKLPNVTPARLCAAFKADLAACWQLAHTHHSDHTPYAFVLYGVESGASLSPHVLTEESLTQVATKYLKAGSAETLEESRKNLRYSVPDSPLFDELADKLVSVNALLQPHEQALIDNETAGYELLAKGAMVALKQLDEEGLFGVGKKREGLLLIIITEDTEKDWSKESAKKLNPPVVSQRYSDETRVEGEYKSSQALVLSPDNCSLYSTGSRNLPGKKKESVSEVVAYDVNGQLLKRRWEFTFPSFGDSGRAIACAPDGQTILVVRCKYENHTGQTLLMRFGVKSNKVVGEVKVPGEPACLAVSRDGSRVAVGMHDGGLHIFDQGLNLLKHVALKDKPRGLCWLPAGELLVGTDTGLLRLEHGLEPVQTDCREPVASISVDAAGTCLALSPAPYQLRNSRQAAGSGFPVLRLPTMELVRTISLSGHELIKAIVSPDGRQVAFDAGVMGAHRHYIVVVEVATGREVARRKAGWTFPNDMAFTRDSCALFIAKGTITPREPIDFWPFLADGRAGN